MAHFHDHDHDHEQHAHSGGFPQHGAPATQGGAFLIAIGLNSVFVAIEFTYGLRANSTALVADAGHNLSDVLGLLLAWGAIILSRRTPGPLYSYGLRGSTILAALANAVFLLVACGAIAWEAVQRFSGPPVVAASTVSLVAAVGIAVNGISALLFLKGSHGDLNVRGAYLHMAADAAVSLGVVISGLVIMFTGWHWLDPVASLAIVLVIVAGTWRLLRESFRLALDAVPRHIDAPAVEAWLRQRAGVTSLHDLHIWGVSTTESALTVHLVMPGGYPGDAFMDGIMRTLKDRFSIQHSTLQVEQGTTDHACALHSAAG